MYTSTCGTELDSDYSSVIRNLRNSWQELFDHKDVTITWPNKLHFIIDHFRELIKNKFVGMPLP